MLVDLRLKGLTGKEAEQALDKANITVNKNAIPFEQSPLTVTSGIRVGTPAVTTRGMKEKEMEAIGDLISRILHAPKDEAVIRSVREEVLSLTESFPLYPSKWAGTEHSGASLRKP
jgi:glycine hydroxymethyltransferase